MLTAKKQLQGLLRIQELAHEIRAAHEVIERAPARVGEIEARFRERNAEYVAVKDRYDELEQDQRWRTGELATLEEKRDKLMNDLMQVKNQREYAAMLKEIDTVKAQIGDHEEGILKDMEEIEKLKDDLGSKEQHIKQERESVERERAQVDAEADAARKVAEARTRERTEAEERLPAQLRATVRQLELNRQGIFLSKVDNGTCQSCFVRIRPQVFQEIRSASKVHTCGNCKRFLYYEPTLKPVSSNADPGGVEAVNGGAV